MSELIVVYLVQGVEIASKVVLLLLGWFPAWKARSKGEGNLLWKVYGACMGVALLMFFAGNPVFSLGDRVADGLFAGDFSPWADLSGLFGGRGRGMSYSASRYITQIDGIRVVAIAYCFMIFRFRKSWLKPAPPKIDPIE